MYLQGNLYIRVINTDYLPLFFFMRPSRLITYLVIFSIFFFTGFSISKVPTSNIYEIPKEDIVEEKTRLLIDKEWMVHETIQNLECQNVHYIRDKINETGNDQGALRLTFKENGLGTFLNTDGILYEVNWKFTNIDATSMNIRIEGLLEHNWNMVVITDEFIMETAKLNGIGLVTARWVPVEKKCNDLTAKK